MVQDLLPWKLDKFFTKYIPWDILMQKGGVPVVFPHVIPCPQPRQEYVLRGCICG